MKKIFAGARLDEADLGQLSSRIELDDNKVYHGPLTDDIIQMFGFRNVTELFSRALNQAASECEESREASHITGHWRNRHGEDEYGHEGRGGTGFESEYYYEDRQTDATVTLTGTYDFEMEYDPGERGSYDTPGYGPTSEVTGIEKCSGVVLDASVEGQIYIEDLDVTSLMQKYIDEHHGRLFESRMSLVNLLTRN